MSLMPKLQFIVSNVLLAGIALWCGRYLRPIDSPVAERHVTQCWQSARGILT